MFLQIILIIVGSILLFTLLKIGSNVRITKKNLELIEDIIPKLDKKIQYKIDEIINWHRKYGYPIFTERSIKYLIEKNIYNKDRFTIVVPLSYFYMAELGTIDSKKWIEWANILEVPYEIDKKSIDYIVTGRGDVDFIWGIDLNASSGTNNYKEKIYLEDIEKKQIEGYVYSNKQIIEKYIYHKKSLENHNKFGFMYLKTKVDSTVIDSYHVALKNPIEAKMNKKQYTIDLISFKKGESYTFYYRSN